MKNNRTNFYGKWVGTAATALLGLLVINYLIRWYEANYIDLVVASVDGEQLIIDKSRLCGKWKYAKSYFSVYGNWKFNGLGEGELVCDNASESDFLSVYPKRKAGNLEGCPNLDDTLIGNKDGYDFYRDRSNNYEKIRFVGFDGELVCVEYKANSPKYYKAGRHWDGQFSGTYTVKQDVTAVLSRDISSLMLNDKAAVFYYYVITGRKK